MISTSSEILIGKSPEPLLLTPLLLTSRQAAKALAISERTLWGLTAPRGPIPVVPIGRAIRYALEDLRDFVARKRVASPFPEPAVVQLAAGEGNGRPVG